MEINDRQRWGIVYIKSLQREDGWCESLWWRYRRRLGAVDWKDIVLLDFTGVSPVIREAA